MVLTSYLCIYFDISARLNGGNLYRWGNMSHGVELHVLVLAYVSDGVYVQFIFLLAGTRFFCHVGEMPKLTPGLGVC